MNSKSDRSGSFRNSFAGADFSWLQMPALAGLLEILDSEGEEARVVGGAVRNALLGEAVSEWDIATTALPETVIARAEQARWKTAPTGIAHGTVTVIAEGHPFEVTTLREDIETDGRHALVRFGRDFRTDAFRRDFTINAISISRDGALHDYADGLSDLTARRIRFIGDADRRIAEDYLRILRLFRFQARYGAGPIDPESLAAAIRGKEGLRLLSAERIRAEMLKLVMAPRAAAVLAEIEKAGFLSILLSPSIHVGAFSRLVSLEASHGIAPDAVRRLAVLAVSDADDADRLAAVLRLSRAEAKRFGTIGKTLESTHRLPNEANARELLYRMGRAGFEDGMLAAAAHRPDADFSALFALADWAIPRNPFGGHAVARLGIEPGKRVGEVLAVAEQAWIDAGFPEDKAARQAILEEAARRAG